MLISLRYLKIPYFYHASCQVLESHPKPMLMVIARQWDWCFSHLWVPDRAPSTVPKTQEVFHLHLLREINVKCSVPPFPQLHNDSIINRVLWEWIKWILTLRRVSGTWQVHLKCRQSLLSLLYLGGDHSGEDFGLWVRSWNSNPIFATSEIYDLWHLT